MQLLRDASSTALSDDACARELFDTLPLGMRIIRQHMRRHRSGLTVPQFRTLYFVSTYSGCSLSATADFIGLSLPAMSRLVDWLVEKGLMESRRCPDDRRQVKLSVTASGDAALRESRQIAQAELAKGIAHLTPEQRAALVSTMQVLRDAFSTELESDEDVECRAAREAREAQQAPSKSSR